MAPRKQEIQQEFFCRPEIDGDLYGQMAWEKILMGTLAFVMSGRAMAEPHFSRREWT